MSPNELDREYLKTLTILYVEDDAETRDQLGQFLKRRCGCLVVAGNGADGLEKFTALNPRIVVTDILMAEMDGLEMSGKIRELDSTVPIIVTTAFEQTDYMGRSIDVGVDKYVVKPVDCGRLHAALLHCARRLRAEEQLQAEQRLATEALRLRHLEALNVLAGGMAHDFNNLLQAILGFVYLAKVNVEPASKAKEFLDQADDCSLQARALGERLLLIANGSKPVLQTASLGPVIQGVVDGQLAGTGIAVEYNFPASLPLVTFADLEMREVFYQLTVNAHEAMPHGGSLRISAAACRLQAENALSLPAGDYLQIVFADSGVGITAEQLPKIFFPYFSTKEIGTRRGLGLGLALGDTIIRKHDGRIMAESTPGEGTVFNIWLPLAYQALAAAATLVKR